MNTDMLIKPPNPPRGRKVTAENAENAEGRMVRENKITPKGWTEIYLFIPLFSISLFLSRLFAFSAFFGVVGGFFSSASLLVFISTGSMNGFPSAVFGVVGDFFCPLHLSCSSRQAR